ncbi:phosphatidylinositol 4-phosphate 5-kinase 1, putative [Babesia ovata]|uniref:Phosphatidylinositol 4-phosphate 5-kinase 1, putative n=1 Tax=Babesia ovata TaxID=189622 RepID=A0A2H6KET8_9APIC|nr:phosphatidylinositol 4-phosphate 5-kinase 1, putative [Babesia ovata]GBE61511.1 phosphatidylinositol 4-phosphate 5-kinase 1, putative [Babesia ovata]
MAWRVKYVEEIRFVFHSPVPRRSSLALEHQRDRRGLDRHLACLLVEARVSVPYEAGVEPLCSVWIGEPAVVDEPIAADAYVAYELRLAHQRGHEAEAEPVPRQPFLEDVEALRADILVQALDVAYTLDACLLRFHNGLLDGLGVFVLDEDLHILEWRLLHGPGIVFHDVSGAEARYRFCSLGVIGGPVGVDPTAEILVKDGTDVVPKLIIQLLVHSEPSEVRKRSDSAEIPKKPSPQESNCRRVLIASFNLNLPRRR